MFSHWRCVDGGTMVREIAIDVSFKNEILKGRNGRFRVRARGVCFSREKGGGFDELFLPYEGLTWKPSFGALNFRVMGQDHATIWFSSSRAFWDGERGELIDLLDECKNVRYPALLRAEAEAQQRREAALRDRLAKQPSPRLIRTAREGEEVAADWLAYLDGLPAELTPVGADSGVDAYTAQSVAQVKMEAVPTGRPAIQMLFGVAMAAKKRPVFFSLAGYTVQAVGWADEVKMPLLQFDLQGVPTPVNAVARELLG